MAHPGIDVLNGGMADGPAIADGGSTEESIIGRIEEWVVSTVDGKGKPSGDPDWIQVPRRASPWSKRPAKASEGARRDRPRTRRAGQGSGSHGGGESPWSR